MDSTKINTARRIVREHQANFLRRFHALIGSKLPCPGSLELQELPAGYLIDWRPTCAARGGYVMFAAITLPNILRPERWAEQIARELARTHQAGVPAAITFDPAYQWSN